MKKYTISGIILCLAIAFVLSYIFQIDLTKEYGWWGGFWQGGFAIPHWIMSWFDSDILVRAVYRTTGYNVWWWLQVIWLGFCWLVTLLNLIILIFRGK